MKRKLVAIAVAGAFWSMSASAENTGCGLGTMIWDGDQGIAPQVMAVTTNGTSGNQTFGISTGTLGCERDGVVRSDAQLSMYTGSNLDMIARDMSRGSGESLHVLADLMGVEESDRAHFYTTLQRNYGDIFASPDVTAGEVISAIDATLRTDERLARYSA